MKLCRVLFAASLAAAACGGTAKNGLTVSGKLSAGSGAPAASDGGVPLADGITLTRARIAVRQLRVEDKSGTIQVKLSEGPLLIDVAGDGLKGSLVELVDASVPAGTYDKLKLQVHRIEAPAAAAFEDLIKQNASILLEGQIDGKDFTFASSLEAEAEHEGAFTVGAGATNITLDLDASKWFTAADGSRLDPSDPAARAAIEANILASFSAFQDDDEDGIEDQNDDHGQDGADAGDDNGKHGPGDDHGQDGGNSGPGGGGDDDGIGHT